MEAVIFSGTPVGFRLTVWGISPEHGYLGTVLAAALGVASPLQILPSGTVDKGRQKTSLLLKKTQ
jgi:hypothetical protein